MRENIRTETVPIFGEVTCHRLMLPQLRGALEDVVDAGLAGTLKTYNGCYVPRFIERNPDRPISLHTWGIAVDLDAATNYRGIRGTMDERVVRRLRVHRPHAVRARSAAGLRARLISGA